MTYGHTPDSTIASLERLVCLYREAWLANAKTVDVGKDLDTLRVAIRRHAEREGDDVETVERAEEIDRGYGLGDVRL